MSRPRCIVLCVSLLMTIWPVAVPAQEAEVIPDQYIVVFEPGADVRAEARLIQQAHGVRILYLYAHAVRGFAFRGLSQVADALARRPAVRFVVPDRVVNAVAQTLPTGIDRIDADLNGTARIDGVDERVNVNAAILDTGIDVDHPDLNVAGGTNCSTSASYDDVNGHGTHVAGTLAALDNGFGAAGVAPGARLYAVKVLNDNGTGSLSSVICGVDWITSTRTDADTSNDIAVANMSLTSGGADDNNCGNTNGDVLHQAICRSVARGVVYVVAAGNDGKDAAGFIPAAYDEVLTVSAVADSDGKPGSLGPATSYGADDTLASFSNWGADVDVGAPGVSIFSTYAGGSYATGSGTSVAAPHATGAVALYIANHGMASDSVGVAAIHAALTDPTRGYSVAQAGSYGFTGDRDGYAEPMVYLAAQHDVAVAAVNAPAGIAQGDSVSVTADVINRGNFAESFTVSLSDDTARAGIGSQSLSLSAGGSARLAFTWATSSTTSLGDHVLTAVASTVVGETATANNSKSTVVSVKQAVHDVAVTGIAAPLSITEGATASITVVLANEGTYAETFTVTLTDTTSAVAIGSQSLSLPAGGSTDVTFTWATSSATGLGEHALRAEASQVTGETDVADNSRTTSVTITAAGAIHVGDLDAVSTKLAKGQWQATVSIATHAAGHSAQGSATVYGTFKQGAWSLAVVCTTGTSGTCAVSSGTFPSTDGKATFVVDKIVHASDAYDPAANHDPDGDSDGTTVVISK